MTQVLRRLSLLSLPWIFAISAVTACSNPDSSSIQMPATTTTVAACQGGPPPTPNPFLIETLSTGFIILSSNSKPNTTGTDGQQCCPVKENLPAHECGKP
jgi:hypothetical protein